MATKRKSKPKAKFKQTQAVYAEMYDRDVRTIRDWQKKNYPLDDPEAMEQRLAEQLHQRGKDAQEDDENELIDAANLTDEQLENPGSPYYAKLYEAILRCRKLAHGIREAKRLVISRAEVREGEMRVNAGVKSRLLSLAGEMPARLAGKNEVEIQALLRDWTHETLSALSDARSALYA